MRLLLFVVARNEESQLIKTVRGLQAVCPPEYVKSMVLLLARDATEGCRRTAGALQNESFPIPVEAIVQPNDNLPGCVKAILKERQGFSHFLIVASDFFLESGAIGDMVTRAARDPDTIYKFSRAMPGGSFGPRYSKLELWLYRLFSAFIRLLYSCDLTDPAFAILVAPASLAISVRLRHSSLLGNIEWLFALLRVKAPIVEVPAINLPRTEMKESTTFIKRLFYIAIALRIRVVPKKRVWSTSERKENINT